MTAAFAEPQEGAGVPLTPTASRAECPRRNDPGARVHTRPRSFRTFRDDF